MCFDPLGKAREECTEVSSLPQDVSSGNWTQVTRFGGKCLIHLTHLYFSILEKK